LRQRDRQRTRPACQAVEFEAADSHFALQSTLFVPRLFHDGTRIGKAIAASGGGGSGHTFNVNVKGLVSPDNLSRVMKQISSKVAKGQGSIVSSNTFRITKRSA
jgi:hypothetical protein